MFNKIIWPILSFISISLVIVFIIGFVFSINIDKGNPEDFIEPIDKKDDFLNTNNESNPEEDNILNILVMGDSIGFGIGDETNKGIGKGYKELINKEESKDIEVANISVPGDESDELLNLIENKQNDSIILKADIIIISIGGNDINSIEYEDALSLDVNFKEILKAYKENLEKISGVLNTVMSDVLLDERDSKYRVKFLSAYRLDELIYVIIKENKFNFMKLFSRDDIKRNLNVCLGTSLQFNRKNFLEYFITEYKTHIQFDDIFQALKMGNQRHNVELGRFLVESFPDFKSDIKISLLSENYSTVYVETL